MRGQAERQLPAGGVAHHEESCCVEVVALRDLPQEAVSVANVLKRAGPAAARITYAAVFDIPGGKPSGR